MSCDMVPGMWSEDGIHGTCPACMGWLRFHKTYDRLPDGREAAWIYNCIDCHQSTVVKTAEYKLYEEDPEEWARTEPARKAERIAQELRRWDSWGGRHHFVICRQVSEKHFHMYGTAYTIEDARAMVERIRSDEGVEPFIEHRWLDDEAGYHKEVVE